MCSRRQQNLRQQRRQRPKIPQITESTPLPRSGRWPSTASPNGRREGWQCGPVALADVAESTGAADLQREREARYRQDRESWRTRLRQYQGPRHRPVSERDGWWSLDDPDEYNELCRWPLIRGDTVRAPPGPADQQARDSA